MTTYQNYNRGLMAALQVLLIELYSAIAVMNAMQLLCQKKNRQAAQV